MLDILRDKAKDIVREDQADYLGDMHQLILFPSRQTRATLAIHIDRVLDGGSAAVRAHIAESNTRFIAGKTER